MSPNYVYKNQFVSLLLCMLMSEEPDGFLFFCLSVHPSVHACAGVGGSVPISNWLWTLFVFLAQRRLWTLQSVPG